jgi:hypothetical protein
MSDFTTTCMPYINTILLVVGGLFLRRIIKDKNSQIETLTKNSESTKNLLESTKVLVEMYDLKKFKEHLDFTVSSLDEKHKIELEKTFTHLEKVTKEQITKLVDSTSPWLIRYNELLNYQFYFLLRLSDEDLQKVLKLLPQNKEFIETQLKDIKSGKLKSID